MKQHAMRTNNNYYEELINECLITYICVYVVMTFSNLRWRLKHATLLHYSQVSFEEENMWERRSHC